MKITVLSENTACSAHLQAEHGLSLYIETGRNTILFDTGQGALFAKNADKLGIDLKRVGCAVISHGHYDHGGGLQTFLQRNAHAPVYISRYAFLPYFSGSRYIGLDPSLACHPRLVFTGENYRISDTAQLLSCRAMPSAFAPGNTGMNRMEKGKLIPDNFLHEQFLLIRENGRRIVFGGCAHKGIANVVCWLRPDIYIGGFHFKALDPEAGGACELAKAAQLLQRFNTRYLTCHCTGEGPYAFLKQRMTGQLSAIRCGETVEI